MAAPPRRALVATDHMVQLPFSTPQPGRASAHTALQAAPDELHGYGRNLRGGIRYGMIRLGFPLVSIYPNTGIMIENRGHMIFHGTCQIGNNSAISLGKKRELTFGNRFGATTAFKLVCYDGIRFADNVLFGWDCLVMDTDFHALTKCTGEKSKGHAPIAIGANNWFGNGCRVMKRTRTCEKITVQAGTTLSGPVDAEPCTVVGFDHKIVEKAHGVWRNPDDDSIVY